MKKRILIVGANFQNKGAQSMLFVTVDEIKKRLPDCEVYFAGKGLFDEELYTFHQLYYSESAKKIALGDHVLQNKIKCFVKDTVKLLLGRKTNLYRYNDVKKFMYGLNLIIDVSGFNLGEKWSVEIQESYLNNIRLAKKYSIPMVMMPQSFGGFDYSKEKEFLLKEIAMLLQYPKIIFAREKKGYQLLVECFSLTNVQLSTDLVLQNKGIDLSNIYKKSLEKNTFPYIEPNSVAIIPNIQCFKHGDSNKIIQSYKDIIFHLIEIGRKVYIFRHSKDDLSICQLIANQFCNTQVVFLNNDFSCLEYDTFIKNFEFAICSRFHGIVHAYRNYIPCILLGWEVKYQELAENVGQEKYVFDITDPHFDIRNAISAINVLIQNSKQESKIISEHLTLIREKNCFDQIDKWIK